MNKKEQIIETFMKDVTEVQKREENEQVKIAVGYLQGLSGQIDGYYLFRQYSDKATILMRPDDVPGYPLISMIDAYVNNINVEILAAKAGIEFLD